MYVHVHTLAGVDQRGHPARAYPAGVAAGADVEEGIVQAVHNDVVVVREVYPARREEVRNPYMWHRVEPDNLAPRGHSVHHDAVHARGKGLVHAGAPVEEHIQYLCRSLVGVGRAHDTVAALVEICPRGLLGGLQHAVYLGVVFAVTAQGLVLEDEEEAARERLAAAHVAYEPDVIVAHRAALCVGLALQLGAYHGDVPV